MAVLRRAYLDESGKENDQEEELGKARDLCAPILISIVPYGAVNFKRHKPAGGIKP
jgi:hypothetical protein